MNSGQVMKLFFQFIYSHSEYTYLIIFHGPCSKEIFPAAMEFWRLISSWQHLQTS